MDPRTVICVILLTFHFVLLLRMVLSFIPLREASAPSRVRDGAVALTNPVVLPLRRQIPPLPGAMAGFGLAELLLLILLVVLERIVCSGLV